MLQLEEAERSFFSELLGTGPSLLWNGAAPRGRWRGQRAIDLIERKLYRKRRSILFHSWKSCEMMRPFSNRRKKGVLALGYFRLFVLNRIRTFRPKVNRHASRERSEQLRLPRSPSSTMDIFVCFLYNHGFYLHGCNRKLFVRLYAKSNSFPFLPQSPSRYRSFCSSDFFWLKFWLKYSDRIQLPSRFGQTGSNRLLHTPRNSFYCGGRS